MLSILSSLSIEFKEIYTHDIIHRKSEIFDANMSSEPIMKPMRKIEVVRACNLALAVKMKHE